MTVTVILYVTVIPNPNSRSINRKINNININIR